MQTLNVGAGRTNEEYKETEEKRRADLRGDTQSDADFFFWAAGLAALGTGLIPGVRLNIFVGIGALNLLSFYARWSGGHEGLIVQSAAVLWVLILLGLGFMARRGHRWAFMAGMVLYGADLIPLLVTFSIGAFAVHAIFLFKWYEGQQALKELGEATVQTA